MLSVKSRQRLLLLALAACISFTVGYGTVAKAFPTPYWRGYFYNVLDSNGLEVLPPWGGPSGCQGDGLALPMWVNTASEFINFIGCKLGGSAQNHIGAAFIMATMTGMSNPNPGTTEFNEFAARVNYAASQGWIDFGASVGCILPNTYYQDGPRDIAAYGGCGSGGGNAVIFYGGAQPYIIKRFCANPVGSMTPIADDINFNMSGSSSVNDTTVSPNQTISFTHSLTNGGPTGSASINWTTQSAPGAGGPWSNVTSGNAGTFTNGQNKPNIGNENVTVPSGAAANSQICRRILWSPDTHTGGSEASAPACATVQYNFDLTPTINVSITGPDGPVTGSVAEPGDTITFTYAVNNTGTTASQPMTCTYRRAQHTGYSVAAPTTVFTPAGATCAPFPPLANTTSATEPSVPANPANASICRSFTISPVTVGGGTRSAQACVHVAAKPYARVYGGDVVAGGGIQTSTGVCSSNSGAAVIGWNRRGGGPAFAGAGAQYGIYAMSRIFDFAAGLGNPASSPTTATKPSGLSFANTSTNVANGNFGGSFGSVPCMTDYYGRRPAATTTLPATIGAMTSGIYGGSANTNIYFGGPNQNIDTGEKITVYVDGNAYINTNILYAGAWNSNTIPSFQMVVRGDIFIDLAVNRLDGQYVAQPRADGTGGRIYTCASTLSSPSMYTPLTLTSSLGSQCANKLTVNGSFVAKQVHLLRTVGSLRASTAGEASSSANIAEVFNYNPALWISQPTSTGGVSQYDAINSLPPVL